MDLLDRGINWATSKAHEITTLNNQERNFVVIEKFEDALLPIALQIGARFALSRGFLADHTVLREGFRLITDVAILEVAQDLLVAAAAMTTVRLARKYEKDRGIEPDLSDPFIDTDIKILSLPSDLNIHVFPCGEGIAMQSSDLHTYSAFYTEA